MNNPQTHDSLSQLLNVFWLRPETALWRSIDIKAMQGFAFTAPSLDLGCGDGIFSFVRAGGGFDISFDAYATLTRVNQFFENADVYDNFNDAYHPVITQRPHYDINVGFDHKENLLAKARTLDFYDECVKGDANFALPFAGNSFNSVFSNIIYWLDRPEEILAEIRRILCPRGTACLMLPNTTFPEYSFYYKYYLAHKNQSFKFLEYLDRGRFADNLVKHAKSFNEWSSLIKGSGLDILRHSRHISKTTAQIWDIGMRPLFPVLVKMRASIDKNILSEIKKEWINTLKIFLSPLGELDSQLDHDNEPAFHCFLLQKRL